MFQNRRHKWVLFIVLILGLSRCTWAEEAGTPVSYALNVRIDPALGNIAVQATILVPLEDKRSHAVQFALHETFVVKRLSINGRSATFSLQPAEPSPISPATKNVSVKLPSDVQQNWVRVDVEYEGHLKNLGEFGTFPDQKLALDDQINSRLVELANYSSWYPQFFTMGYPIELDLELSLPEGWVAICSGKKIAEDVKNGRIVTRWVSAKDTDILIAASQDYKEQSVRLSDVAIEIYYTQLLEPFIERDMGQIGDVMKLFVDRLGETTIPAGTIKHVYSPKRKGQGRAGIARPGMIVTSEGLTLESLANNPQFSLFQDIAHEIAHFWWNCGAGQGDWINEAFAEYFSAVAVQKVLSEQQFASVLENYRSQVRELPANAPALSTVPFNGSGFVIRYYKGSLLLDYMRHILGDDKFFQASRNFFETCHGKSIGTAEFRSFWKQELGEQKNILDAWLDSKGSLPVLESR